MVNLHEQCHGRFLRNKSGGTWVIAPCVCCGLGRNQRGGIL